jgi:DNA repair exonuclease SbcCD ATPase subunit
MANSRIIRLQAENVKRLVAVEIKPDPQGNLVIIGGKNAQGKSSVLDAIYYALAGKKALPVEPIRKGEKKAEITVELDEIIIRRIMTEKTDRLEVSTREGAKFASPQALLDGLTNSMSFDPLAFARLGESPAGEREQANILRRMTGLDTTEIDQRRKELYDERTNTNRDAKAAESRLAALQWYSDAPEQEVSIDNAATRLQNALRHNAECEKKQFAAKIAVELVERLQKELAAALEEEKVALEMAANFQPINTASLQEQIRNADAINAKVRANEDYKKVGTLLDGAKGEAARLAKEIEILDAAKAKMLAEAKMPVPGLAVDESGISLNTIPLSQCSSAEQLKVSVAIGLAQNPELKIMLCRDGSLLDDDSLKALGVLAAEAGAQVWLERVGEGAECSVVIEDGSVKA